MCGIVSDLLGGLLGVKSQPQAATAAPVAAPPAPQDAKAANPGNFVTGAQAANSTGNASTLLTGASGVNPDSLNIGKNTLLGT